MKKITDLMNLAPDDGGGFAGGGADFGASGDGGGFSGGSSDTQPTDGDDYADPFDFGNEGGGQASGQPEPTYKLKVQGEEVERPLSEILELAQKGDDYTRKTMRLSEREKELSRYQQFAELVNQDPELASQLERRLYERHTGRPYTPQGMEELRLHQMAGQVEHQKNVMNTAYNLQSFMTGKNSFSKSFSEGEMEQVLTFMESRGIHDPEVAYSALSFQRGQTRERYNSRPNIASGVGAPSPSGRGAQTMDEAFNNSLRVLQQVMGND